MKIITACFTCSAECFIEHDLREPYKLSFCPFCGDALDEDDIDEVHNEDTIG